MKRGDYEGHALPDDDFPGRFFACWEPEPLAEVVAGAGFELDRLRGRATPGSTCAAAGPGPCPTSSAPDCASSSAG